MGPLNGRPGWNQVSAPVNTASAVAPKQKAAKYAGVGGVSTSTVSASNSRPSSSQSKQAVKGANVKKMSSKSPKNDVWGVEGGKGLGGY